LIIYILSPFDAHPLFLDDIIASGILFYLLYRNTRQKRRKDYSYTYSQSGGEKKKEYSGDLTVEEAYRALGLDPDASWDEIKKTYKGKIAGSHPDKVSHLSKELQEKAQELTLRLNSAFDVIKHHKGR
jgi:DnaJ-domain-containing protein 1